MNKKFWKKKIKVDLICIAPELLEKNHTDFLNIQWNEQYTWWVLCRDVVYVTGDRKPTGGREMDGFVEARSAELAQVLISQRFNWKMPQSLSEFYTLYFFRYKVATDACIYFLFLQKCSNILTTTVLHVFYLNVMTKSITNFNFDENRDQKIPFTCQYCQWVSYNVIGIVWCPDTLLFPTSDAS